MSNTKKTNGDDGAFAAKSDYHYQPGLTKREEFAKTALQGILAGRQEIDVLGDAYLAVRYADALIRMLNVE